ncbi:hypothetical protein PIIN_10816 [Serendipita indica DSM 11827]|uniref:Uncharacterized protein n=1 Tax=Serendipita indica (strain DSM 11827) TaxID=1109443 RepID=G4TZT7_SERID|nr:hypothetical protein PIIN_10816 [Serendipita indica DSM 11827]
MALVPIVNSGKYRIRNWTVALNADNSHTLYAESANAPAIGGGPITEVSKRFYISLEKQSAQGVHWFLQPVFIGSDPRILYAIYEPGRRGHWELCSADKKKPVKLNKEWHDDENRLVPMHFTPEALWVLEHVKGDE